ncbi:hypothetical protein [Falsiroseomonas sp. HW251]|uniref:hypothetical protein n=1 Tax=Falsiroseomonas sp. HW251 TaxID=3390998 RepID=UPI003D32431A
MPEPLADQLRRAGYDLPQEAVTDLSRGHQLLQAMLKLVGRTPAEAEPATTFRPDAAR